MRLAPEGWPFIVPGWIAAALGIWAAVRWGGWVWAPAAALAALAVWLLVFFRDPTRSGPRGDHLVIAPADGRVLGVVETDEPTFLKTRATRVAIFMNVFDVHVNRYPISGTVELVHYHPGRWLHAATDKASLENERASVGLRGRRADVLVRQIAGLVARRVVTDGRPGDHVDQAQRMGMIRFGSRVEVFVPLAVQPRVTVREGDRVAAGATVLMELPR
jgi:phosphatidylserine decarboxylase